MLGGIGVVEVAVRGFDRQPPAIRHGVACVDREVQHDIFELTGISIGLPEPACQHRLHLDRLAQRPTQELGHVRDHVVRLESLRRQGLLAREGEKALRQGRGPVGSLHRARDELADIRVALGEPALNKVQSTDDDCQHVVEVVCDAAGELAHGLHLLHLSDLVLGPETLLDGIVNPLLQCQVEIAQFCTRLFCGVARLKQLPLVPTAVGCIEHRHADEPHVSGVVASLDSVDQDGEGGAVRAHKVERNLIEEALHSQQRGEVRLVIDLPRDVQKVLEPLPVKLRALMPQPCEQGLVDLGNPAFRIRRHIAARRTLKKVLQIFQIILFEVVGPAHPRTLRGKLSWPLSFRWGR